jgi:hypothetical protein
MNVVHWFSQQRLGIGTDRLRHFSLSLLCLHSHSAAQALKRDTTQVWDRDVRVSVDGDG